MAFIILNQTIRRDKKVRYVQVDDEHKTLHEAREAASFTGWRNPIIVDLANVERPRPRLKLT